MRTVHPVECHALRLTAGGRTLVYTGDTGPSERVTELARGADVLLAEAAHPPGQDQPAGLHLTGREAGEHATAAGVGRLLHHPRARLGGRDRPAVRGERGVPRDRAGPRRARSTRSEGRANGRRGTRRRPADQPRQPAGRRARGDQARPRRLPGRGGRPDGAAAGRPAAVGPAGAARAGAVHAAQRVQGRAGLGADGAGVVGRLAPRDRPGALRRPAHAAVAGQPARRRVPRPVLPDRGRRTDGSGARPRPARGRGLRASSSAPRGSSSGRSRTPV